MYNIYLRLFCSGYTDSAYIMQIETDLRQEVAS